MPNVFIPPDITQPPSEIPMTTSRPDAERVILEAVLPHYTGYHHVVGSDAETFSIRIAAALRALGLLDR